MLGGTEGLRVKLLNGAEMQIAVCSYLQSFGLFYRPAALFSF